MSSATLAELPTVRDYVMRSVIATKTSNGGAHLYDESTGKDHWFRTIAEAHTWIEAVGYEEEDDEIEVSWVRR